MARVEDLEKVSQAASGELTGDEARKLSDQIDFERGVQAMRAIDRAAAELRKPLANIDVDALVASTLPPQRRIWRRAAMGALAVAAAAIIAIFPGGRALGYALVELSPGVRVNGAVVSGYLRLKRGDRVETSDGHAVLTDGKSRIVLAAGTAMRLGDVPELLRGTAEASGDETAILSEGHAIRVNGRAIVTLEPLDDLLRVSQADTTEGIMKLNVLKLGAAAGGLAAVGAVALLVTDGTASVKPPSGDAVRLDAGERWAQGEAKARLASGPVLRASAATPINDPGAKTMPRSGPVKLVIAARDPTKMSRDELIAEVNKLRNNPLEAAKQSKETGDDRFADHEVTGNWHRYTPDQLKEMADRGRLQLRIPHDKRSGFSLGPNDREGAGVTEAEYNLIRQIYDASYNRLREGVSGITKELGRVPEGNLSDMIHDIEEGSPKGKSPAIRQIARERAGLTSPGNSDPPIVRLFRLMAREDDHIVDDMDALFGPERAAQIMNYGAAGHSMSVFEVGPEGTKDDDDE